MTKNTDPAFAGIAALKIKQAEQLEQFEQWATARTWNRFHNTHYDWWMFPVEKPSSHGYTWTVMKEEVQQLKQDPEYIENYLRGVELLMLAWGWNLQAEELINNTDPSQTWHNWPIRLHKCASSLLLFGFHKEFNSVKKYAQHLIKKGEDFNYNGRDLSELFTA
ncbi:hypothetical protein [Pontibacter beigongshangensis]|uniref:hypothetical protein n=1 Tax=Pontibacter beigongshangensis TaxID=2574733 RepID=UPI00164FFD5C|nr:hypothetical protein [Pontibacter beigongshangensis]